MIPLLLEIQQYYKMNMNTNCVLRQKDGKKSIVYLPGYLRVKVKNFTQMNLSDLSAQLNATIIFSVFYDDLQLSMVQKLKSQIILLFGRDDAIKLKEEGNLQIKVAQNKQKQQIQFTIRKLLNLRIQSQVFWSPFQIINLILTITVQPVSIEKTIIKINLMDSDNALLKLSYSDEGTFGNYNLAASLMKVKYSNQRVYKLQQQQKREQTNQIKPAVVKDKIEHFQYAHFNIPLYKYPVVAIATIFLPWFLLAIINLGIFFQSTNVSNRIQNLSALLISFVALIPTIRQQIPPNPKIVFIQILVYLSSLTSLLALIHTLDIRLLTTYNFVWYQNGLFLVSGIITFGIMLIVIVMMCIHYCIWLPSYNNKDKQNADSQILKFKRHQWKNPECDRYFQKWSEIKRVLRNTIQNNTQKKTSSKLIDNIMKLKPLQIQGEK